MITSDIEIDVRFAPAWEAGLACLQPSESELEHGLELHRQLTVCESYGFLPGGWSREAVEAQNGGLDGRSFIDQTRRMNYLRSAAMTLSAEAREETSAALDQAGVSCIVLPANDYGESLRDAVERIAAFQRFFLTMPERLFQTIDAEGIDRAKRQGATAVIYSLTGMPIFGAGEMSDPAQLLEWVTIWHAMGVRFMHLGYNRRNLFAEGCTERNDGGVSELGRDLIEMMNRTGIIVDVPHSSRKTLLDATRLSPRPVVVSHAGCRAIFDGCRCKSDEEIKAIAATGGYIGINSVPQLIGEHGDLNIMLRHVEHAVKLVGAEHVVIGSDLGYSREAAVPLSANPGGWRRRYAGGWAEHARTGIPNTEHLDGSLAWTNRPLITVGLVKMGLSDDDIAQIHYGNLRRVLSA